MVVGLFDGMRHGLGTLDGPRAVAANLLLLLQFPLLHSFLLTRRGRAVLAAMAPSGLGKDLAPTTYALIGSLQLCATFLCWSPSGTVWWEPHGVAFGVFVALTALAWLFLLRALWDGCLGLQTGAIGWLAVLRGRRVTYPAMPEQGLFRHCRQPIYLGFALTLWTGPVWTPDHLSVALAWTTYCVLGPRRKEQRFAQHYGAAFSSYRERVPYLIPFRKSVSR